MRSDIFADRSFAISVPRSPTPEVKCSAPVANKLTARSGSGHDVGVPVDVRAPSHRDLVADLRRLREIGFTGLRGARLDALAVAAMSFRRSSDADAVPRAVEDLIRHAVQLLAGNDLGRAAEYTFGTTPGTRDLPASVRRRRAAAVYQVSVERFRKAQELVVVSQVAETILSLLEAPPAAIPVPMESAPGGPPLGHRVLHRPADDRSGGLAVTMHIGLIELSSDIDILAASENTYMQPSQTFKSSTSAALRLAATTRGPAGEVIDDIVQRELDEWMEAHARHGLPVGPGTVVPTSSGRLAERGVRRIYHVAVAVPQVGTNDYLTVSGTVTTGVANLLALARSERYEFDPPLTSIGMPLFGAGRGGLDPERSLSAILAALSSGPLVEPPLNIHLIVRRPQTIDLAGWESYDGPFTRDLDR
jgi:hypothetical protein